MASAWSGVESSERIPECKMGPKFSSTMYLMSSKTEFWNEIIALIESLILFFLEVNYAYYAWESSLSGSVGGSSENLPNLLSSFVSLRIWILNSVVWEWDSVEMMLATTVLWSVSEILVRTTSIFGITGVFLGLKSDSFSKFTEL